MTLPPDELTTNQSEEHPRADHAPTPLPHTVFKNPSLNATGEFRPFQQELPVFLAWSHVGHLATNAVLPFATARCQQTGFTAQRSGPKFGLLSARRALITAKTGGRRGQPNEEIQDLLHCRVAPKTEERFGNSLIPCGKVKRTDLGPGHRTPRNPPK